MSGEERVGLLFGGRSVEHEVSVISARGVASALEQSRLTLVPLAVTGEGRWLDPERSAVILRGDDARVEAGPDDDGARVLVDPGGQGLLLASPGAAPAALAIDVAFPLIHGWGGEDGRLQGALELAGIPYAGSDVLGSAVGMDKAVAKRVLAAHGVAQVPWLEFSRTFFRADPAVALRRVQSDLGLPVFVKPANGGSSVGITRVASADGLQAAFDDALAHDRKLVVERGVDAREIECAVLGNDRPEASGLGEIIPCGEFYDYEAKYLDDRSRLEIPADLDPTSAEKIRETAVAAYRALGLCGFARVDFLLERNSGVAWLNEVNTLPGFTPISMFPKLWAAAGLSYPKLIERLIELALERARDERSRRTRWTR